MPPPGGTLYVVATPLGNLADLTPRGAEALRTASVVAAEDTRRTRALLAHLDAHPRLLSYHAHSSAGATSAILKVLREGRDVALVTDAGTPAISDPGAALVSAVRSAGYPVIPLPGASAVTTALSAAGLPADRYLFLGFLPRKGAERARLLQRIAREEWTIVLFEAPGRVGELLGDLARGCGETRRGVVARELTKIHEEVREGSLGELAAFYGGEDPIRGECTIVLEGGGGGATEAMDPNQMQQAVRRILDAGVPRREAAKLMVELFGVRRNDAYRAVMTEGRDDDQ